MIARTLIRKREISSEPNFGKERKRDATDLLIPLEINELEHFWSSHFNQSIKNTSGCD